MKLKIDFITNSSSASFTIMRCDISPKQELLIIDHLEGAALLTMLTPDLDFGYMGNDDKWDIEIKEDKIEGYCSMDNFDMITYLNLIGIPHAKIEQHD